MAFLDENGIRGLKREIGVLAAELAADGAVKLRLRRSDAEYMQRLPGIVAVLETRVESEPLRRLGEAARTFQACARRAKQKEGIWLPGCGKYARIDMIASKLISGGDRHVSTSMMCCALMEFDELQNLTMDEYWAFPDAMRIAVSECCVHIARNIISAAEEYERARKWVESGGADGDIYRRPAAFFERALQLTMEVEKPDLRLRLENALARMDTDAEACVRLCQENAALMTVRLGNLLSTVRALEAANWQKVFESASRTEAELRSDPDGIYPGMSDSSRTAVRARVAMLARRLRAGETTVARYAVNAAREMPAGDVRRSVCWWLYDDKGSSELARRMGESRFLPKLFPDPKGYAYMAAQLLGTVFLSGAAATVCGSLWWMILMLPLAWHVVFRIMARIVTRYMKPRAVLRMEYEKLPDRARTLVAIPALLTNPERAREMCRRLEITGCLEKDENIEFVLLGDFADAVTRVRDTDMAIMDAAVQEIARMNAAAGRVKYHYLQRERTFAENDGIYRGFERKRGALMSLCRVATGHGRGEFTAEGSAEEVLFGRFRYLVTLDADTRMLPGTVNELVGAIAHPLNAARYCGAERRGFAVMQPIVELDAEDCVNPFVRVFAGTGGLNTYSGMVSDFFHDIAGSGSYCGKAVIDMPVFLDSLEGKLGTGRVLSHDFIEGLLGGAGHINDVSLFDGFPENYQKWLSRMSRWTRGDWQLIPDIFRRDIPLLGRFRLISHLTDSLREIALLALFVISLWIGNAPAFAAAIAFALLLPAAQFLLGDRQAFIRGSFETALLPAAAFVRADAICRALWRMAVSHRRLMEWVTSADASGDMSVVKIACRSSAILLLPGLFSTYWAAPAIALGALFLIGPGLADDLAVKDAAVKRQLDSSQKDMLRMLARDTWKFFERYVDRENNFLPPDNVQIDPDNGAARRTSPTNIGMYMMACVCAKELGYIGETEMHTRLADTVDTLQCMEKWHGHLYNWYDTAGLEVLSPRYVSAVDSGNLAAALLLCANACSDDILAGKLRRFAEATDFSVLYDVERDLFHIGMDVGSGRLSASHYDLLASESRILSYTALMLGQVPMKHWRRLGRPVSGDVLMSWSGTMFEYFMPTLIMPSAAGTLMGNTCAGVVREQMKFASARSRPWGVSESGFHSFDMNMNYQYRAFGLRTLSMSGTRAQDVVAPYGACLGLMENPTAAAENIRYMLDKGWAGECGLYEAIDFVRREPRAVKSWMAHHQGMALCAITNVLTGNILQKYFMDMPEAGAVRILLNERAVSRIKLKPVEDAVDTVSPRRELNGMRPGRSGTVIMDTAMLGGADGCALVAARGDIVYSRRGVYAARFTGDMLRRSDGMFTDVIDEKGNVTRINSRSSRCMFGAGEAAFCTSVSGVDIKMRIAVSPEDGALVKHISFANESDSDTVLTLADGFETALMDMGEMRSHPAFHRLFCSTELKYNNAIVTRRRMREKGAVSQALVHASSCSLSGRETDWMRLMGREGRLRLDMSGRDGAQTDPCSALKMEIKLAKGETREIGIAAGLCDENKAGKLAAKYSDVSAAARAVSLAGSFVRSAAGFAGLDNERRVLAERACALLVDPRLSARGEAAPPVAPVGDHGDLPRLCIVVDRQSGLDVLRDAVRMHEYCRALGFVYQLALIYEHGSGYEQPVRDGIYDIISASHLRDMCYARGGITVYDALAMPEERRMALLRGAALKFDSGAGYWAQLRRSLMALRYAENTGYESMPCAAEDYVRHGDTEMKYGRMEKDGYVIDVHPGNVPPAPWSDIIIADKLGMLITERGGGFIWYDNSRLKRITGFDNDPANEGWHVMLYVADRQGRYVRALPGMQPDRRYAVRHGLTESVFSCAADGLVLETAVFADRKNDALIFRTEITNTGINTQEYRVTGFVNWLMGTDGSDAAYTRAWNQDGILLAAGTVDAVAYFACDSADAVAGTDRNGFLGNGGVMQPDGLMNRGDGGCALTGCISVNPGEHAAVSFVLGCGRDMSSAMEKAKKVWKLDTMRIRTESISDRKGTFGRFSIRTGDEELDGLINGFILKQAVDGRTKARAGFYQAGGAFGFRDQLQDMLALIPYEPQTVREHILECARHQFADGDVMHWWHPPMTGVRTHISDDMLFLPFVTYHYVMHTGDMEILECETAYLKNIEIPSGREDIYAEMEPSGEMDTLRNHCMRAFRRGCRRGEHGLLLMGSGDWNDGMNRVGDKGRGESVWLTMFFTVCAGLFAKLLPEGMDRAWLENTAGELKANIEKYGWDGGWYLRAYDDSGNKLGSKDCNECRIDLIAQAWSVFAGLDDERSKLAMSAAWDRLFDEKHRILRLLAPAFAGKETDPGYIAAYPQGVRENGGQYTHAACWYLLALAKEGNTERAKQLLKALLPPEHSRTTAAADVYRTEPYVIAADVYGEAPYAGRGGWTWYTGAAGWLICAIRYLIGYERKGDRVRLNALRGMWERPMVVLKYGSAEYTLISDATAEAVTVDGTAVEGNYVYLADDGHSHECIFPMR